MASDWSVWAHLLQDHPTFMLRGSRGSRNPLHSSFEHLYMGPLKPQPWRDTHWDSLLVFLLSLWALIDQEGWFTCQIVKTSNNNFFITSVTRCINVKCLVWSCPPVSGNVGSQLCGIQASENRKCWSTSLLYTVGMLKFYFRCHIGLFWNSQNGDYLSQVQVKNLFSMRLTCRVHVVSRDWKTHNKGTESQLRAYWRKSICS